MTHQFINEKEELLYEREKLFDYIWGYSQLGMHKEAIAECEKLIKLNTEDASSYIELGLCYEETDNIEKAIECYKFIMKKFPMYSRTYVNLGYIYERRKKRAGIAMVCYEKAFELNPNDEWAINNIGAILQKEGKWKDARIYYEKAYKASKANGEPNKLILHNLAWAHYHCKNYKKAMELYHRLTNDKSDNAAIYADFGCVNFKIGAYRRALKLFRKALSLCPDSRHYQRLYRVTNRKSDSEEKGLFKS